MTNEQFIHKVQNETSQLDFVHRELFLHPDWAHSALTKASEAGNVHTTRIIAFYSEKVSDALLNSVQNGRMETAKFLYEEARLRNENIDIKTLAFAAINSKSLPVVTWALEHAPFDADIAREMVKMSPVIWEDNYSVFLETAAKYFAKFKQEK